MTVSNKSTSDAAVAVSQQGGSRHRGSRDRALAGYCLE